MNMFWNKKEEKKSLPDLPPIKSPFSKELAVSTENAKMVEEKLDEAEQDFTETHSLPTFPDSPNSSSFSQAAIKEAITQDEIKEPEENVISSDEPNKKFRAIEMNEDKEPQKNSNPYLASIKTGSPSKKISYTEQTTPYQPKNSFLIGPPPEEEKEPENNFEKPEKAPEASKGGDVFVKIEKFYSAKKSLDAIKDQIDQIDELLKKIRDIKLKEERELSVWEKEIALVKSRIQNVNETIFEKLS